MTIQWKRHDGEQPRRQTAPEPGSPKRLLFQQAQQPLSAKIRLLWPEDSRQDPGRQRSVLLARNGGNHYLGGDCFCVGPAVRAFPLVDPAISFDEFGQLRPGNGWQSA